MNFGVFVFLVIGLAFRRKPPLHMAWMTFGFALDTALLLFIELDREATKQLFGSMDFWLVVHILISFFLVALYPMMLWSGGRVSAGMPKLWHKRFAIAFFVMRFLLAVTAYLAVHG